MTSELYRAMVETRSEVSRNAAEATRHLTARAAGEIALTAGVGRVTPFHFSGRYLADPEEITRELHDAFGASKPEVRASE